MKQILKRFRSKKLAAALLVAMMAFNIASSAILGSLTAHAQSNPAFSDPGCSSQENQAKYQVYKQHRHSGKSKSESLRLSGLSAKCYNELSDIEEVADKVANSLPTESEQLRATLKKVSSVEDTQKAFFNTTFPNEDKELSVNLKTQEGLDGSSGYQPVQGSKLTKFTGNPFFYVDTQNGDTAECLHDPDNGDCVPGTENNGSAIRFVLTSVVYGHEPDIESPIPGGDSGDYNAWVFRNEFNPSIAIELTARNDSGDEKHLVYYKPCDAGIIADSNQASQIDWGGDLNDDKRFNPTLTSSDNREDVEKVAEAYGGLNVCDVNNSFFNAVLQNAMTAVKEALTAIYDWIKDALLNVIDIGTLTSNGGLVQAWKTIRDFVNLLFVILLSVVAFSNILRIDTERYGVRALLPRLIFAVIAVNFSFLLVQIMTNVAYIVSQPFISKAFQLLSNPPADGSIIDPTNGIGSFLIAVLLLVAVLIGFVILFVFFVIRILVIWLLAALSPFVFLLMVLPLTRNLATQWWKNAFKWIFMGPIAFVLLFVAAEMLATPGNKNQDINGPDFLLSVAFFVAAAAAAVMIPLKLGGEIMARGANATKRGAGLGARGVGKAGMFAADRKITSKLPGGGDATLGTRLRAGKQAFDRRDELKEAAAGQYLNDQIEGGKGVGRIVKPTEGQKAMAQQGATAQYQKEMATLTPVAKKRIAYAHAYGMNADGTIKNGKDADGNVIDNSHLGALNGAEQEFAKKKLASQAAFAELAQAGQVDESLNERYADSGMAQLNQHNPALSSLDRSGEYSVASAQNKILHASPDDLKNFEPEFWQTALKAHQKKQQGKSLSGYENTAYQAAQKLDASRAAYAVSVGHRNSMPMAAQRKALADFARAGGFKDDKGRVDMKKNATIISSHDSTDAEGMLKKAGYAS